MFLFNNYCIENDTNHKLKAFLPYNQDQVWQALTDSKLLGSWFMENNIEPTQGHYFTFRMKPQKGWDGITHCKIIAIEPQKYISYTYRGEATGEKALACAGIHSDKADQLTKGIFAQLDTILSFTLEPTCGGTILYLEHSGYKGLKLAIISLIMQMGWKKQLKKKLPKALEKTLG
nr:SRPBCC domain-containing protein [Pedobacter montanisoli]